MEDLICLLATVRTLKTSKEQCGKNKTTHKRVKLPHYPLQRQIHPFEQMERSALYSKKSITSFGGVKDPNSLSADLCSYFQSSCHSLETHFLFVNCLYSLEENSLFSVQILTNVTLKYYPTHAILVICKHFRLVSAQKRHETQLQINKKSMP